MAIYDKDAVATTAISAFLAQFSIAANGDIRFVAGTDTFHVTWLDRALQHKVWDFAVSGDDNVNLSSPNPSTSEALGTIINLLDHTTTFSVRYNITAAEAEYFFGGSITQQNTNGEDSFRPLIVVGSKSPSGELLILQNNTVLTSFWSTGLNQTDGNTLLRILVQTVNDGAVIDGHRVTVKCNEWGFNYAWWKTTLGLTESTASIIAGNDPQNTTLLATIQALTGISNTEGFQQLDIGDGSGAHDYLSQWVRGSNSKQELYEYVKAQLVRGAGTTLYGIPSDLFLGGPTFTANLNLGTGGELWVQNETVSWTESGTASTGILIAVDDPADDTATQIWIHILTGINPTSGTALNGAAASQTVSSVTSLAPSANHLGQFTGNWIGDEGIGFAVAELTQSDSVNPLDLTTPISPPNNVNINLEATVGLAGDDPHAFLAKRDAVLARPETGVYTVGVGNTSGDPDFVLGQAIPSDIPQSGYIGILDTTGGASNYEFIEYTSWTGSTFTLAGTLPRTYTAGDPVFLAIFYQSMTGAGTTKTATSSLIYSSDIPVIGWIRNGDETSPDKPVIFSGTITQAGFQFSTTLEDAV